MSKLIEDIAENVIVMKKKDLILKWTIMLLPYVITGAFLVGGMWVTYKNSVTKSTSIETKEGGSSDAIMLIKSDLDRDVKRLDNRIDITNQRIDGLYDSKSIGINNNKEHN